MCTGCCILRCIATFKCTIVTTSIRTCIYMCIYMCALPCDSQDDEYYMLHKYLEIVVRGSGEGYEMCS